MNTNHFLRALTAILSLAVAAPASAQCTGDLTGNGIVDGADLGTILSYWGPRTQDPTSIASDLDGNGLINGADLGLVLSNWGPCQSTITSISPNEGCIVGGTQITITGTYLGSTSAVTIGGTPATSFTVVNQNTVQATAPAAAAGPVDLRVTTVAGTITAPQQFTYMPASITSIAPSVGVDQGGTPITITGAYLALTTAVTIGGAPCTDITVVNASTISALTPAGTAGNADVVIFGGKGTTMVPGGYRYVSIVVPSWASLIEAQPDPAVVADPVLRNAIAATGLAWRIRDNGTGIEMLLVPPGTFRMGCFIGSDQYGCNSTEQPVHTVTLTQPYYLGRYEVTQAQWEAQMEWNPSHFRGSTDSPSRPVENVSWNMIHNFSAATGMRLPTEAEWEYACRAGTQTPFYNGSTDNNTVGNIAWCSMNAGNQTHAVGGKPANAFGFHDMLGNVYEWVSDWYGYYLGIALTNPTGPVGGSYRVIRGGSFIDLRDTQSSTRINGWAPDVSFYIVGFRVARNP